MALASASVSRQLSIAFEDAPLWDASSLEGVILREAGRPVRLTLTENRSVLLSFRRHHGTVLLRLHRMFLHAPLVVVRAVARSLRRTNRSADGDVRRFMNDNLHRVRKVPRALPPLLTAGRAHDLKQVFEALNARFFDGQLRVPLTWGRGSGRARRGGLTFGSYDPVLALIRIHPVLDRRDVPMYFLESVVYHEMLHHHMGGIPDRAGPHRLPFARLPRGRGAVPLAPAGAGLGEGEPSPSPPGQPRPRPQAQGPGRGAPQRLKPPRHLRRLLPYLKRHRQPLLVGLGCLLAAHRSSPSPRPGCCATRSTTSPSASPARSSSPTRALVVGGGGGGGLLPLPDAHDPHRGEPRDRVRAARRPLRAPHPAARALLPRACAPAT